MSDVFSNAESVDPDLWIRTAACDDRDYLVGNSHTFPGRMAAYCPTRDVGYSVSLYEIEEMSPEAARWVAGFLSGNEPAPDDMFGPGMQDAFDADPRWHRWHDALAEFRAAGTWGYADWANLIPFPRGTNLPALLWTLRGDEVWSWDGDAWVRTEPQPRLQQGFIDGTVCAERGHCILSLLTTAHAVCDDCGNTTHVLPAGFTREEWDAPSTTTSQPR